MTRAVISIDEKKGRTYQLLVEGNNLRSVMATRGTCNHDNNATMASKINWCTTCLSSGLVKLYVSLLSWRCCTAHNVVIWLTEIQLFDANRRRIELEESDVMVRNVQNPRGDIMSLFNGKYKVPMLNALCKVYSDPHYNVM